MWVSLQYFGGKLKWFVMVEIKLLEFTFLWAVLLRVFTFHSGPSQARMHLMTDQSN